MEGFFISVSFVAVVSLLLIVKGFFFCYEEFFVMSVSCSVNNKMTEWASKLGNALLFGRQALVLSVTG
jgi:hypothetical protein